VLLRCRLILLFGRMMSFQEYYEAQIAPLLIHADNVQLELLKIKSTLNPYEEMDIRLLIDEGFLLKRGMRHIASDFHAQSFQICSTANLFFLSFLPCLQVLTAVSPALRASITRCGSTMDASLW